MSVALDYEAQYALLSTFQLCIANGAHFTSLTQTLDDFVTAFDLNPEHAASLQQVKSNFENGQELYELFRGCEALDKRVVFFLTLPYPVKAGRWSESFDIALGYLERLIKSGH